MSLLGDSLSLFVQVIIESESNGEIQNVTRTGCEDKSPKGDTCLFFFSLPVVCRKAAFFFSLPVVCGKGRKNKNVLSGTQVVEGGGVLPLHIL